MKKNFLSIILFLGLYIFSTGISYALFTFVMPAKTISLTGSQTENEENKQVAEEVNDLKPLLDVTGAKTEVCPLTNELFTATEKEAWEARRPLLVMVENHEESRPQSGLSSADVVYETVAEGGITRFMTVFYCDAQSHEAIVGPVRSVRTYFLDWASEYGNNPLFAHVGGANCNHGCPYGRTQADALGQIDKYGWGGAGGNDLNQFSIGYPTFWRDYERLGRTVATEHTMYSTTERLWAVGKKREWTNVDEDGVAWDEDFVAWKFSEKELTAGDKNTINYNFWDSSPAGDFSVTWTYDPTTKLYLRSITGGAHIDLNTNKQLAFKNIIVMYSTESPANDGYDGGHLLYGLIGSGKGVWFSDGNATEVTWKKASRTARTIYSANGKEIELATGKTWISNLPVGNESLDY